MRRALTVVLIVVALGLGLGNIISAGHGFAEWTLSDPFREALVLSVVGDNAQLKVTIFMVVAIVVAISLVLRKAVRLITDVRRIRNKV